MGYRSDVVIVIYPVGDATPFAAIKLWFDENYPAKDATEDWGAVISTDDATHIKVQYNNVKWYAGYGHVEAVEQALNEACELFNAADGGSGSVAYELGRVGENEDDVGVERSGFAEGVLGVQRRLYTEWD